MKDSDLMLMLDEQKDITGVVVTRASTNNRVIANRDIQNRGAIAAYWYLCFNQRRPSRRWHS